VAQRLRTLENMVSQAALAFWAGRRVLLTGHTGFKGSWLAYWLYRLGAQVTGIALPPDTTPSLFTQLRLDGLISSRFADVRHPDVLRDLVQKAAPEVVLHLAAQPLVRASYREPVATFATNVMGSVHLLEAIRATPSVRTVVMVTTDKVYLNDNKGHAFSEDDRLGGHDPYSASKAASEIAIASYRQAFLAASGVAVSQARCGNIVGGGDWSADRIIPDAVRAWTIGETLAVRRPTATRPWQHVLDGIYAYLHLAYLTTCQPDLAGAYNFGPPTGASATVRQVVDLARAHFGRGAVSYARETEGPHEASELRLDVSHAAAQLQLSQQWNISQTLERTMTWYRDFYAHHDARALCLRDIEAYTQ
jgi:CDP-glucose 4,6-dehydratase